MYFRALIVSLTLLVLIGFAGAEDAALQNVAPDTAEQEQAEQIKRQRMKEAQEELDRMHDDTWFTTNEDSNLSRS
jgi:arginine deiminase